MTILRRPKINTRRKNLLLVAAALVFIVPCVAAAPFAFRIGVDTQSTAVSPDDNVVSPRASVVAVQQGDRQKAKQKDRAAEQRKTLRELRPEVKYRLTELKPMLLDERLLHDGSLAKKANITMQQAIQIAMSQQRGTVMQYRLIGGRPDGEQDQVFYILTIVSGDEPKSPSTTMLISAVDGRVVRTWKNERASLQPVKVRRKR